MPGSIKGEEGYSQHSVTAPIAQALTTTLQLSSCSTVQNMYIINTRPVDIYSTYSLKHLKADIISLRTGDQIMTI